MNKRSILTVLAAMAMAACGGGDLADTVSASTSVVSTSSEASASEAPESTTTTTQATTTTAEPAERADYTAALLTLEDLPFGFTTSAVVSERSPGCDSVIRDALGRPDDDLSVSYQETEFGPIVSEAIYLNESDDSAADRLNALRVGIDGCLTYTQDEIEYTYSPLAFPKIADETFAARASAVSFFGPITVDLVVWRDGSVLVGMVVAIIGDGYDPSFTESTVKLAVSKLP